MALASTTAVGWTMGLIAFTAIVLGVEKFLKWLTRREVEKIRKKMDKLMDEIEEWSREEG